MATGASRRERARGDRLGGGGRKKRRSVPPTLVVLVRHGTTETTGKELPGRAAGLNLSDEGRRQAEAAAARLAALAPKPSGNGDEQADSKAGSLAVVYASPLERAQQTAAPIAAALGCDVRTEDDLADLDTGDWTGLKLETARKRKEWGTIQRYPSGFRFPGGESFVGMQTRMLAVLDRLRTAHPGQLVVAVSHADPIRAVVAHALGTHLDLFQRILVSPGSLTAIAYSDEGPVVLTVNDTDGRALAPTSPT
jgi:broad specificity phosphatase PhoE